MKHYNKIKRLFQKARVLIIQDKYGLNSSFSLAKDLRTVESFLDASEIRLNFVQEKYKKKEGNIEKL